MKFWEFPGDILREESSIYTHICPILLSVSIEFSPIWVRHMGYNYTQAPGIWGCVLCGMEIAILLDFT